MITSYILQADKQCVLSLTLTEKVDWRACRYFWYGLCIFTPRVLYVVLSSYSNAVFEKELLWKRDYNEKSWWFKRCPSIWDLTDGSRKSLHSFMYLEAQTQNISKHQCFEEGHLNFLISCIQTRNNWFLFGFLFYLFFIWHLEVVEISCEHSADISTPFTLAWWTC